MGAVKRQLFELQEKKQANCKHENTIRVGDSEHEEIFCTDCEGAMSEQDWLYTNELQPF